jgi:prolyl-tRNA synthetase
MAKANEPQMGITVKKEDDMPEWYSQVILKSELADHAPVRGCMVIRPTGYAVWQNIVNMFDANIKKHGVKNAYFPLFIPESFFTREAEHAEGFKAEVAWIVTKDESGERLAIRPTSETIMYDSYSKWIRSWRDLPLKINQWCNVVRWEVKDVKLFLRSREFLWQEGHCVYETQEECHKETLLYLEEYRKVLEDLLAVPVILGQKTEKEKFAGADRTYTIEGFMPDGKALQLGTSHDLSQGFAKAFNLNFLGRDEKPHLPWQNSWGFSTRTIGGMIMAHSDNKGLVLPPRAAPTKAVIVPILFGDSAAKVMEACRKIMDSLKAADIECFIDDRENYTPGWKFNEWELKGIPIRLEVGPKDVEKSQAIIVARFESQKRPIKADDAVREVREELEAMHFRMLDAAKKRITAATCETKTWEEFIKAIEDKKLVLAPFCGKEDCEEKIKDETGGVTSRCIPLDSKKPQHGEKCAHCGNAAEHYVYFAKAY